MITFLCDLCLEDQDLFHFKKSHMVSIAEASLCDILKLFHGSNTEWSLNWRKQSAFAVVQTGQVRISMAVPNLLTLEEN